MTPEFVIGFGRQAMEITLLISMPLLGVSLAVGLIVSILQAATQIQEATLTFVPKVVCIFIALLLAFPWMLDKMVTFTSNIFLNMGQWVHPLL
jgi:flagellar biosynthetic protein FliQ